MVTALARPPSVGSTGALELDSVHRVLTIVAAHPDGWAAATATGVAELARTITDLRVAKVIERDTVVRSRRVVDYRVKLQVSFRIDARRIVDGHEATVRRYLVVLDRGIDDTAMADDLVARFGDELCELHVLVPLRVSALTGTSLMVRPWSNRSVRDEHAAQTARRKARQEAEGPLEALLARLRAAGAAVTSELSFADPCAAAMTVLDRAAFDEIIVASPPPSLSRLTRMDLPSRLRRNCDLPVTAIGAPGG